MMRKLISILLASFILAVISVMPAQSDIEVGPIGLHTFSGETIGGIAVGLHVIPDSETNKLQAWASKHITLDVLQVGTSLDSTNANLGTSINLLAPEGSLKFGVTYLWEEDDGAVYLGWSLNI